VLLVQRPLGDGGLYAVAGSLLDAAALDPGRLGVVSITDATTACPDAGQWTDFELHGLQLPSTCWCTVCASTIRGGSTIRSYSSTCPLTIRGGLPCPGSILPYLAGLSVSCYSVLLDLVEPFGEPSVQALTRLIKLHICIGHVVNLAMSAGLISLFVVVWRQRCASTLNIWQSVASRVFRDASCWHCPACGGRGAW